MSRLLPIDGALLALVFLGRPSVYPWTSHALHPGFQAFWLSRPFFLVRAFLYVSVWIGFATAILRAAPRRAAISAPIA